MRSGVCTLGKKDTALSHVQWHLSPEGARLVHGCPKTSHLNYNVDDGADCPYDDQAQTDLACHDPLVGRHDHQQKNKRDEHRDGRDHQRAADLDMVRLVMQRLLGMLLVLVVSRLQRHPRAAETDTQKDV